jgi:hypothetical protein
MKQADNGKITALYERLSKDDEQKSESVSTALNKTNFCKATPKISSSRR